MLAACRQIHACARDDVPVTVYYAYKQSETDATGTASTGWETMLSALIRAGFAITGTWPVRSESPGRILSNGANALSTSIVLVCRKRPPSAPVATRRELTGALRRELRAALAALQAAGTAPVDLAQAAIGPGMGVYSRYAQVLEADGTPMGVRAALALVNQELDAYLNDQGDELDRVSRLCVELYAAYGYAEAPYGVAEQLATAKNVLVAEAAQAGVLASGKGKVRLLRPAELPQAALLDACTWRSVQLLQAALAAHGVEGAGALAATLPAAQAESARTLAYRLYSLADRAGRTEDALGFNGLVASWSEVAAAAAAARAHQGGGQGSLF